MATLESKVIVYDDSCPMCRLYTWLFVRAGILREENRIGFAHAPSQIVDRMDLNRARHEIPLVDRNSGEVRYGLDALMTVLSARWPFLAPVVGAIWFKQILKPLYQLITYNRRVMAGCRACSNGFDCAPDLNRVWRSVYLLVSLCVALVYLCVLSRGGAWATVCQLFILMVLAGAGVAVLLKSSEQSRWDILGNAASVSNVLFALTIWACIPWLSDAARIAIAAGGLMIAVLEILRRRHVLRLG